MAIKRKINPPAIRLAHEPILSSETGIVLNQVIEISDFRLIRMRWVETGQCLRHTLTIAMYRPDDTVYWALSMEGCVVWRKPNGELAWMPPKNQFGKCLYEGIKWLGELGSIVLEQVQRAELEDRIGELYVKDTGETVNES